MKFERGSPDWFSSQIRNTEKRLLVRVASFIDNLAPLKYLLVLTLSVAGLLTCIFWPWILTELDLQSFWASGGLARVMVFGLRFAGLFLFVGPLISVLRPRYQVFAFPPLFLIVASLLIIHLSVMTPGNSQLALQALIVYVAVMFGLPFLTTVPILLFFPKSNWKWAGLFIGTALAMAIYAHGVIHQAYPAQFGVGFPIRMLIPFSILLAAMDSMSFRLRDIFAFWFFPVELLQSTALFPDWIAKSEFKTQNYVHALWDLIVVLFIFVLIVWLRVGTGSNELRITHIWIDGTTAYLYYYLMSWGLMRFFTFCMRVLGFQVPDAFDSPLLAASPMDRWRRWNFHIYEWTRVLIFQPALKRFKSLLAALILAFLATWITHAASRFNQFLIDPYGIYAGPEAINHLIFYMWHALAIYIALKLKNVWPSGQTNRGWLGVLITWAMMIFIHLWIPRW